MGRGLADPAGHHRALAGAHYSDSRWRLLLNAAIREILWAYMEIFSPSPPLFYRANEGFKDRDSGATGRPVKQRKYEEEVLISARAKICFQD